VQRVVFDFDIISPYAYLAFERLPQALEGLSYWVEYRPVLFAGLLKHWGTKGPVETPPKKAWLHRQTAWIAERDGVEFAWPSNHPFNPLALLRLLVAAAPAGEAPNRRQVELAFRHVWARAGADPNQPEALEALRAAIAPARDPESPEIKAALRARVDDAVQRGVFGVPSFQLDDGQLFWGQDSMEMLADVMHRRQRAGSAP